MPLSDAYAVLRAIYCSLLELSENHMASNSTQARKLMGNGGVRKSFSPAAMMGGFLLFVFFQWDDCKAMHTYAGRVSHAVRLTDVWGGGQNGPKVSTGLGLS